MAWLTAAEIVNDAAVELGLLVSDLADPFTSTDQNIVLLCRLLKSEGKRLVRARAWTHLRREANFTTSGAQSYALPADFFDMAEQTQWNRTSRLPLGGPLTDSEWQYLAARQVQLSLTVLFRPMQGKIYVWPATSTDQSIYYEYRSSYWVSAFDSGNTPTSEKPTAGSDTIYFDPHLLRCAVKLAWKQNKGFDATADIEAYDEALEGAINADTAGRAYNLTGPRSTDIDPLISEANLPYTGFGGGA